LKLLRSKAKKRLRTMKFPITRAGRKIAKHVSGPCENFSLITIGTAHRIVIMLYFSIPIALVHDSAFVGSLEESSRGQNRPS
jgi:hypothetical protein